MANSSFAIWAENDQINIDLHINCWIFEKDDDVIDFGLMVSDSNQNDKVHFYIPFIAEKEDIQNLTPSVEDSASLKSLILAMFALKVDNLIFVQRTPLKVA